jgi:hypothetical protein
MAITLHDFETMNFNLKICFKSSKPDVFLKQNTYGRKHKDFNIRCPSKKEKLNAKRK